MTYSTGDGRGYADTAENAENPFCIECIGSTHQPGSKKPHNILTEHSQHKLADNRIYCT
jgi:hypothetical protein